MKYPNNSFRHSSFHPSIQLYVNSCWYDLITFFYFYCYKFLEPFKQCLFLYIVNSFICTRNCIYKVFKNVRGALNSQNEVSPLTVLISQATQLVFIRVLAHSTLAWKQFSPIQTFLWLHPRLYCFVWFSFGVLELVRPRLSQQLLDSMELFFSRNHCHMTLLLVERFFRCLYTGACLKKFCSAICRICLERNFSGKAISICY